MEVEHPPRSIEKWYEMMTNLDRYWRESRREEERLRDRKKIVPRTNMLANIKGVQRQQLPPLQI